MASIFNRLVRFRDTDGKIRYGETKDLSNLQGKRVSIYGGDVPWDLWTTDEEAEIAEVLCPLPSVPIFYGIGLNYKRHIEEAGFPVPQYPVIFTKPPDALAGPYDDILIDARCTNMDYEGELSIIIGKDCKNFAKGADPLEYILGYTVGNDISSRYWQMPPQSGNQHGYAKSFDKFGPIGPVVISPGSPNLRNRLNDGIPDLLLRTRVNGEERQNSRTSDLLFTMSDILEHLSRGTTIRKGTVIMTGTPSGVAAFLEPPKWLQTGDIVEIEIEELGVIRNRMIIG
jgi:2-keto-4-pentenoate hydratase/2-oxohepta-3-ene-1,7-dioic acid hydratase in catechol pathway